MKKIALHIVSFVILFGTTDNVLGVNVRNNRTGGRQISPVNQSPVFPANQPPAKWGQFARGAARGIAETGIYTGLAVGPVFLAKRYNINIPKWVTHGLYPGAVALGVSNSLIQSAQYLWSQYSGDYRNLATYPKNDGAWIPLLSQQITHLGTKSTSATPAADRSEAGEVTFNAQAERDRMQAKVLDFALLVLSTGNDLPGKGLQCDLASLAERREPLFEDDYRETLMKLKESEDLLGPAIIMFDSGAQTEYKEYVIKNRARFQRFFTFVASLDAEFNSGLTLQFLSNDCSSDNLLRAASLIKRKQEEILQTIILPVSSSSSSGSAGASSSSSSCQNESSLSLDAMQVIPRAWRQLPGEPDSPVFTPQIVRMGLAEFAPEIVPGLADELATNKSRIWGFFTGVGAATLSLAVACVKAHFNPLSLWR